MAKGDKIKLLNRFCDESQRHVTGTEAKIWITLWRHAYGPKVSISQIEVASNVGVNIRTIKRGISRLCDLGLVVRTSSDDRGRSVRRYQIFATIDADRGRRFLEWKRSQGR